MCGIACILEIEGDPITARTNALNMARKLKHRGPDWNGIYSDNVAVLVHERLAIVDPDSGDQPLISASGNQILAVNGEIYNHRALRKSFPDYPFKTGSDCEVLLPLYLKHGVDFLNSLSGIFSFVLYDKESNDYFIARDPIGVNPLYTGRDKDGTLYVSSELKALIDHCCNIDDFPPGHFLTSAMDSPESYYTPKWRSFDHVKNNPLNLEKLRAGLEDAVKQQLMSDVPFGVLVSGGLDSSIIAAIAQKFSEKRIEDDGNSSAWWPRLHSFAIGLEDAPDLIAARKVAASIDTVHHELKFTVQEGLDALRDVIYHIESYDVTTIRASTPMFLMARKIKAMGIKMVLSGEGADEIFGGYLYFHKAPDAQAFHEENVRKLDSLHKYDCLRANKSMAAWGVEIRVPFLDREFLDTSMSFSTEEKMVGPGRIEKYPLRKAFEGYIPEEILWRQKEQFSDGVGYKWIESLIQAAEEKVTDSQLSKAHLRFPVNPPPTKEAYMYRDIFDSSFPGENAAACVPGGKSIACSSSVAIEWDESFKNNADPSGLAVKGVHLSAK